MSDISNQIEPSNELFGDYLTDKQLAKKRRKTPRTLRAERQRGDGPPYVKDGQNILYSIPGFREWLRKKERQSVRS
jgi:hypothetical protein